MPAIINLRIKDDKWQSLSCDDCTAVVRLMHARDPNSHLSPMRIYVYDSGPSFRSNRVAGRMQTKQMHKGLHLFNFGRMNAALERANTRDREYQISDGYEAEACQLRSESAARRGRRCC